MESGQDGFKSYAVLELMGHRKMAGLVTEVTMFGSTMIRIDVPGDDGLQPVTQYLAPSALYSITPCTEETARGVARSIRAVPIHSYEVRPAKAIEAGRRARTYDGFDPDDEDDDNERDAEDDRDDSEGMEL